MIIMDPANIEASVDAWMNGSRSEFNALAKPEATLRRVDMSSANDRDEPVPGILGYNR